MQIISWIDYAFQIVALISLNLLLDKGQVLELIALMSIPMWVGFVVILALGLNCTLVDPCDPNVPVEQALKL